MFDLTPTLKGQDISLRPLVASDFERLFCCANDKNIWAGHPSKDRYKRGAFAQWFAKARGSNQALIIFDNHTKQAIGSTRFYYDGVPRGSIAIGYTFLACQYWGGDTNRQLKTLMLDYAFVNYSSVWLHISPLNSRSQKATLKLGAQYHSDQVLDLSGGEPTLYKCYLISRESWLEKNIS